MGSHEIGHSFQGDVYLVNRSCITAADISLAGFTERVSGNSGYIFFLKQQ